MDDIWVCSLHREETCSGDCLACYFYEPKKVVDENDMALKRLQDEYDKREKE